MKRAFREYDKGTAKWEEEIDRTMEVESERWENIRHFMIELELFDYKPRYETDEEVGNVSSLTFSRKGVKGEEQLHENQPRIDRAKTAPSKYESTDIQNISESTQLPEVGNDIHSGTDRASAPPPSEA